MVVKFKFKLSIYLVDNFIRIDMKLFRDRFNKFLGFFLQKIGKTLDDQMCLTKKKKKRTFL